MVDSVGFLVGNMLEKYCRKEFVIIIRGNSEPSALPVDVWIDFAICFPIVS
jgi:hypothetical protein